MELKSLLENDCFKENELAQRILGNPEAMNQIEIEIKYKGYIDRQTVSRLLSGLGIGADDSELLGEPLQT